MATKIKYVEGRIYAGNILRDGTFGANTTNVTDDALMAVLKYIVEMKTDGELEQEIEVIKPIHKYGKPFHVKLTITPIE